jgi:hypothetical protein
MGLLVELALVALCEALGWYATLALETRSVAASLRLILTATGFGGGVAWGAYTGLTSSQRRSRRGSCWSLRSWPV